MILELLRYSVLSTSMYATVEKPKKAFSHCRACKSLEHVLCFGHEELSPIAKRTINTKERCTGESKKFRAEAVDRNIKKQEKTRTEREAHYLNTKRNFKARDYMKWNTQPHTETRRTSMEKNGVRLEKNKERWSKLFVLSKANKWSWTRR